MTFLTKKWKILLVVLIGTIFLIVGVIQADRTRVPITVLYGVLSACYYGLALLRFLRSRPPKVILR